MRRRAVWGLVIIVERVAAWVLPGDAARTLDRGGVVVVEDWAPRSTIARLARDAETLYARGAFQAPDRDVLLRRGPRLDRAVFREAKFSDATIGDGAARADLARELRNVRLALAESLPHRESLAVDAPHRHELSLTRFGEGASLKYHVDEHHEELKGRAGWASPTRRSISWLVYLNDRWDAAECGGELRCYERPADEITNTAGVGASPEGDLQVGWLRPSRADPVARPVYLDARVAGATVPNCRLYVHHGDDVMPQRKVVISRPFFANPVLFVKGDAAVRELLITDNDARRRYERLEDVTTPADQLFFVSRIESSSTPRRHPRDVAPRAGTLVLFDSVTLPHEVLETRRRPRFAASGWFHEAHQPHRPLAEDS